MAVLRADAERASIPIAHPQSYAGAVAAGLTDVAREKSKSAGRNLGRQSRWLIAGAVCYVLWHVLGMAICTPSLHDHLAQIGSCTTTLAPD
jgi:hypothetical protein